MEIIFDRQAFYKMNSEEMFEMLLNTCEKLKYFDVKREDLESYIFEIQIGKRGISPYDYLTAINKKRESEFLEKINDKELMFRELVNTEKKLWVRAFQTNKAEAKAFQDYYFENIDKTIQICKEKGIEPICDYERLKRVYLVFKKKYFETHTIKETREDDE